MTAVKTVVQVFQVPERHPFFCAKCLVGDGRDREFFVHIGIEYDFEGVVYLCNKCLEDICVTTGVLYTREQLDDYLNAFKWEAEEGARKSVKYDRIVDLFGKYGMDVELILDKLEELDVKRGSNESNVDSESGGSEPEIVAAERDSVEDAGKSEPEQCESDSYDSVVNPLVAGFDLDLGLGKG